MSTQACAQSTRCSCFFEITSKRLPELMPARSEVACSRAQPQSMSSHITLFFCSTRRPHNPAIFQGNVRPAISAIGP